MERKDHHEGKRRRALASAGGHGAGSAARAGTRPAARCRREKRQHRTAGGLRGGKADRCRPSRGRVLRGRRLIRPKAKTLFFLKLKASIHTVLRVQISYLFFTFQQLILFYSYRNVPLSGLRQQVKPFTRSLHLNESENKPPK